MSNDKDDTILPLPTRDGPPIGRGSERRMMQNVGDVSGHVTRIQDNPDGSTTRMKTRGGNVEFVTTPPPDSGGDTKEVFVVSHVNDNAPWGYLPDLTPAPNYSVSNAASALLEVRKTSISLRRNKRRAISAGSKRIAHPGNTSWIGAVKKRVSWWYPEANHKLAPGPHTVMAMHAASDNYGWAGGTDIGFGTPDPHTGLPPFRVADVGVDAAAVFIDGRLVGGIYGFILAACLWRSEIGALKLRALRATGSPRLIGLSSQHGFARVEYVEIDLATWATTFFGLVPSAQYGGTVPHADNWYLNVACESSGAQYRPAFNAAGTRFVAYDMLAGAYVEYSVSSAAVPSVVTTHATTNTAPMDTFSSLALATYFADVGGVATSSTPISSSSIVGMWYEGDTLRRIESHVVGMYFYFSDTSSAVYEYRKLSVSARFSFLDDMLLEPSPTIGGVFHGLSVANNGELLAFWWTLIGPWSSNTLAAMPSEGGNNGFSPEPNPYGMGAYQFGAAHSDEARLLAVDNGCAVIYVPEPQSADPHNGSSTIPYSYDNEFRLAGVAGEWRGSLYFIDGDTRTKITTLSDDGAYRLLPAFGDLDYQVYSTSSAALAVDRKRRRAVLSIHVRPFTFRIPNDTAGPLDVKATSRMSRTFVMHKDEWREVTDDIAIMEDDFFLGAVAYEIDTI